MMESVYGNVSSLSAFKLLLSHRFWVLSVWSYSTSVRLLNIPLRHTVIVIVSWYHIHVVAFIAGCQYTRSRCMRMR